MELLLDDRPELCVDGQPFRDWLRSHPDDRLEYERTKRSLAGKWRDTTYYARAKSPVVDRIMERARRAELEP